MKRNKYINIKLTKYLTILSILVFVVSCAEFDQNFEEERYLTSSHFNTISNQNKPKSIKALLDEGKIIIVNAQQSKLSEAGTTILGALLTAEMTIMALGRANKPKEERHPVFAYIDECQNFLNDKIDKLLAEARKYGVHLIMANQFLGQFEGMGRLKESIFANTAIKFCGSASAQDKTTMSKELNFDFSESSRSQLLPLAEVNSTKSMIPSK